MGEARRRKKELAEREAHLKKSFKNKSCFAASDKTPCSHPPIQSHTVAEKWLRQIARDGHVYTPRFDMFTLERTRGSFEMKLTGVGNASAYPIFCSDHDNRLFQPLELNAFAPNRENAGLLYFRAVCRETSAKRGAVAAYSGAREELAERGEQDRAEFAEAMLTGQLRGLEDITARYGEVLEDTLNGSFADIDYYVCEFESPLPISYVGAIFPEFDFDLQRRVDLSQRDDPRDLLAVSCFADNGRGYLALSWRKGAQQAQKFAASFHKLPNRLKAQATLTLAFEHFENVAIGPTWWEALSEPERAAWIRRLQVAGSAFEERKAEAFVIPDPPGLEVPVRDIAFSDGTFSILVMTS